LLEKRLFSRLKLNSLINIHAGTDRCNGTLVDFSENGFSFLSEKFIDISNPQLNEIEVAVEGTGIKVTGRLKWI
jgi:hypothetical protein